MASRKSMLRKSKQRKSKRRKAAPIDPFTMSSGYRDMRADAARSGFNDADIEVLGFAPATAMENLRSVGEDRSGYAIPYPDLYGKPTDFFRVRLFGGGPKDKKYTQPSGTGMHVYFSNLLPKKFGPWAGILKDPTIPLVIVEGEKKSAAMCKAGIPCIGLGGVSSFGMKMPGGLLPILKKLAAGGRKITVLFDSDIATNSQVASACTTLVNNLAMAGADAGHCVIEAEGDEKIGADDLLMQNGVAAVVELLDNGRIVPFAPIKIESIDSVYLTGYLPPQRWVVAGLIPEGINTVLAGPGGVGKSFLILDLGIRVATATQDSTFAGMKVRRGVVVYVSGEDGPDIVRGRTQRARTHFLEIQAQLLEAGAITKKEYTARLKNWDAGMVENFKILCVAGGELHFVTSEKGQVKQSPAVVALIAKLKALSPALVIIDPMARFHGGDENANELGTAMINALERIALETGAAVVLAHHFNKTGVSKGEASVTAVRGGSAIVDGARSVLTLTEVSSVGNGQILTYRDKNGGTATVTDEQCKAGRVVVLTHVKSNHAARAKPVFYVRGEQGGLTRCRETYTAVDPDAQYAAELAKLRTWAALQADGFSQTGAQDAHKAIGLPKHDTVALVKKAAERGDIVISGGTAKWKRYRFKDETAQTAQEQPKADWAIQSEGGDGGAVKPPAQPKPLRRAVFSRAVSPEGASGAPSPPTEAASPASARRSPKRKRASKPRPQLQTGEP